ncbi:exodeoxyribonuclease VII large subunit [Xylanibacter ruminicola]|uniref:Exodeoxyribonuclease 7 large subunit n=1 Tax=Xylanibacter ruminicola TaxID=839 RepID=A0A1M6VLC8_XYLRU|nr:exodeoxyribonuclease VII large subunit [Xylanibacter ruminicola]SHK82046.1 Exodeoxyribonuclease VII large subunit [Xylanibacter ruminicola]
MITKRYSLFELNRLVRESIECEMPDEYWVEAELSECRESRGHCYMELIQKDEQTATPIAKASAKCWANKWLTIRPYFERTTGQPLHAGMKVLLQVYPQFHEAYGFSWIVNDIDPTYTIGDMARKRQEIIKKLKDEGVFDLQKELQLPLFCQHIAVISSQTAAGYGDFCNQLADNPYGFKFETQLFPAIMQGEGVEQSIIDALERIYNSDFDCVVIIRGGGATSDMSGFDTLALAENVANFPLPIITGIGHDRDESILDMVSHTRVKTPTAAAALLIDHLKVVLDTLIDSQNRITQYVQQKLSIVNYQLSTVQEAIPRLFSVVKTRQETKIDLFAQRMLTSVDRRLVSEQHRLELIDEKLKALDPTLLLKRGYSITIHNGRAVKDATTLQPGDEIETRLAKGTVKSIIKSV